MLTDTDPPPHAIVYKRDPPKQHNSGGSVPYSEGMMGSTD